MFSNMDFSPNTFAKPLPVIGLDDDNLISPVNLAAQNPKVPPIPSLYSGRYGKFPCSALWPPPHMFPYLPPALSAYSHLHKENGVKQEKNEPICDNSNFKVPCGKNGNYPHQKHRPQMTYFTKGSLIELANKNVKPVEDILTEDFVLSAEKSQNLQLCDAVFIGSTNSGAGDMETVWFIHRGSKIDIEAHPSNPFFVYGQGWKSIDPDSSLQHFGLKCQRLQIGDVCMSLKPRENPSLLASKHSKGYYEPFPMKRPNLQHMEPSRKIRRFSADFQLMEQSTN